MYIKGNIIYKSLIYVVVEVGGIGYYINISLYIYVFIEKLEAVKILIYQYIKEDSYMFYGFFEFVECNLFCYLIFVFGVGLSIVQLMFFFMILDEMWAFIIGEDVAGFKCIKGIGVKIVQWIIFDFKDKFFKDGGDENLLVNV